ncbi:MAG: aldo/keto reductase [Chitinophagaceae bacterium]|nr:aldo/keto reductase [Chitinophagaceae bacterium]
MKYHKPGKSTLSISEVVFGCMSLGTDDKANAALIHEAIDAGINCFDTANIYQDGFNEQTLGKAVKEKRSKVIIATKVGNQRRADGKGLDWNPRKEHIITEIEESLKRLQTDYIDIYQLHGGTIDDPIDETIEAFEILKQQGKTRFYGISSIRPNVIREYVQRSNIVSVMMQYSLLDRRPEESCFSLLEENKIGILARGSLAGGLLAGKHANPYLNYNEDQVYKMASAVQAISGLQRNASQTALQFVLMRQEITAAVVGIRTLEQLRDIIAATLAPPLSENEIAYLRSQLPANYYELHR